MTPEKWSPKRALAAATAFAAGAYGAYAVAAWLRYGHPRRPAGDEADPSLDRFLPEYEVVERHSIRVAAPAEITLSAACELNPEGSRIIRAIFRGRELIMRSRSQERVFPKGLLASTRAMGWGTLEEIPGREIVMGAIVQPWKPNPVFQSLPPDNFAEFHEPGYVKIAWTLRADPIAGGASIFRSETRVIATDPGARRKFRAYWSFLSPGITVIRCAMLRQVKAQAELRVSGSGRSADGSEAPLYADGQH